MLRVIPLALSFALAAAPNAWCSQAAGQGLVNGDFEASSDNGLPQGWQMPSVCQQAGFRVATATDEPHGGRQCAELTYAGSGKPSNFGNLLQALDAKPFRGKRVRMRAAVRAFDGGSAQLWLRVDGPGQMGGLIDNMSDRPIRTSQWATYDIIGDVGLYADELVFGMMLFERGGARLDDVSFEILGSMNEGNEPARALDDRGLENLTAFARLYGYVRHFHPSDGVAAADWNTFAIEGVRAIEPARDAKELAASLQRVFEPIAPTVQVFVANDAPALSPALERPAQKEKLKLVRWRNDGFGTGDVRSIYTSTRENELVEGNELPAGWRDPRDVFAADLGGGVACRVPLTLYTDHSSRLPRGDDGGKAVEAAETKSYVPGGNDRTTRLADVVIAWNVFEHFYPYFDVVETDWPHELERGLKSAATDADACAFLGTMRRLVAALHDGHGHVQHTCDHQWALPPFALDWAEGKLVVTQLAKDAPAELARGDVVLSIDGESTDEALARVADQISSATPQWTRYSALYDIVRGDWRQRRRFQVLASDGSKHSIEVELAAQNPMLTEPKPDKIEEIESGVWYVDIDRADETDFQLALDDLAKAEGLVFDLRGYPNDLFTNVIAHLIDEPVQVARWNVPDVVQPDHVDMRFNESRWEVKPVAPRFQAKVAFITDGRAISAAETFMGIIEHYKLAEIVGEPTAGTNGNINPFSLPGGYYVSWTGMKVLKHDGSQHHGVGIRPTIPASRTIAGIAAGRDELLERAIETVRP